MSWCAIQPATLQEAACYGLQSMTAKATQRIGLVGSRSSLDGSPVPGGYFNFHLDYFYMFCSPIPLVFLLFSQMVVDVIHPGRANVAKEELSELLAGMYKGDPKLTITFGFRTKFGGGKSTGFCLIYDNHESMMKFEPKYRMIRKGQMEKKEQSRKAMKEAKNKGLKVRGTGRRTAKHKAKRAGGDD